MSTATFTPASARSAATLAETADSATAARGGTTHPPRAGGALRAAKAFVSAAFGVVVLGEYAEEAGVRRR
ncbi:hypothetical protein ACFVYR_19235 [Streptomyces sp. NPDC058284]|uniref:hypothetical protein n=1 Tax=unclassified Streptomyces TaxID=2593676 RepID=UPI00365738E7